MEEALQWGVWSCGR